MLTVYIHVFKGSVRQKYEELAKSEINPEWISTSFFLQYAISKTIIHFEIFYSKNERINLKLFAVIPFGGS